VAELRVEEMHAAFLKEHLLENWEKNKGGAYFKEARIDSRLSNSVINTIACY
jgi:hypothetical protein